ncbi:MAG TPA: DUF1206 domain-containing protein [Xanthobacteraceae bacterium]|jgi:hypothetical protein|nr:DUF1206 domain-containing protein [Xanthobacteraceae bacterium]
MSRAASAWIQWLARAGYAARGVVFIVLAYFTAVAAVDAHARPVDSKDALGALLKQPLGGILLSVITLGLLCFAAWREGQAFLDLDRYGSDLKGLARRSVYGAAGLFYAAFGTLAFSMILGAHTRATERAVHDWAALLLAEPFGPMLVGAIGGAIMIAGVCIGVAGVRADFENRIGLQAKKRRWVTVIGSAGYLTRAAVIFLIGVFVVFAALDSNAHEATGLAGALTIIKRQPYGGALLVGAAVGFLAFGVYGLAEALFRRVDGRSLTAWAPSWMSV